MRSAKSSFRRLAEYLIKEKNNEDFEQDVRFTNILSEGFDYQVQEIVVTQKSNVRAKSDKTYHLIVSFREGEQISREVLNDIETTFASELGYSLHQRLSVLHSDTENLHLHIAFNKINPKNLNIIEPYYDKKKLGQICERLEEKHNLQKDNHKAKKNSSIVNAKSLEQAGGLQSFIGWVKNNIEVDLLNANNWDEVHRITRSKGLDLKIRGRGFIFTNGKNHTKASSVNRLFSKGNLEKKFGSFKKSEKTELRTDYKRKPIKNIKETDNLWLAYNQSKNTKRKKLQELWQKRSKEVDAAYYVLNIQRALMRLVKVPGLRSIMMLFFKQAAKSKVKKANKNYNIGKDKINKYHGLGWLNWLNIEAQKGNAQALKYLQSRKKITSIENYISGVATGKSRNIKPIRISNKGTLLYENHVSETKDAVYLSSGSIETVVSAITIAQEKFDGPIKLNGSKAFIKKIVDISIEENLDVTFENSYYEERRKRLTRRDKANKVAVEYIGSRNLLKEKVADILNHRLFNPKDAGFNKFKGIRTLRDQKLVLFENNDEIIVSPISDKQANIFKKFRIGTKIELKKNGTFNFPDWNIRNSIKR